MNDDYIVIEYIIDYFILIQTPFQVFESTTVRAIRKYNFKEDDCLNLISAYTISLQVFGKLRLIGNRFRDNSKLPSTPSEEKDRVDRRIFAPYLQRIEVEEEDRTALLQLPTCVKKQPGTGHQRQL